MMFQHVTVGTGVMGLLGFGSGGFGLLLVPLMFGIGWMFYDSKARAGWAITAGSVAMISLCYSDFSPHEFRQHPLTEHGSNAIAFRYWRRAFAQRNGWSESSLSRQSKAKSSRSRKKRIVKQFRDFAT